jgi:hypothetical protein
MGFAADQPLQRGYGSASTVAATTPIRVHSCLPSRNHMKAGAFVVKGP